MAEINHTVFDRTLAEIDKKLEAKNSGIPKRNYVGMSSIGKECQRELWYTFRLASRRLIGARGVREIQDGFTQEDKMAERLRLLPGIELHTVDPNTGKQISFSFLDGHFSGHADGVIKGILEAPEKWHIWEHKSVNEEKFNKLKKLRIELGEKQALKEWDFVYWTQAQCYMAASDLDRHFLTVSTPGGRDYISVRTERSLTAIDGILEKAHGIIHGKIPDRISNKREFYLCKFCSHFGVCHDGQTPLRNCGTCSRRTILKAGKFGCLFRDNMDTIEPCGEYEINSDFGVSAIVESGFRGEKVDGVKIHGWK